MTPLDICNRALLHIGRRQLITRHPITQHKEHPMNEGEHIQITKLENGFNIQQNGRTYQADDINGVASIVARAYGLNGQPIVGGIDYTNGRDRTVSVLRQGSRIISSQVTDEADRDELGELRRFKQNAEVRGAEQNQTIKQLSDNVEDMKYQRDDYRKRWLESNTELQSSEELSGTLYKQIADMEIAAKVKAKAKKKSVRRKA